MRTWSGHDEVRYKITAFLFNRRADALRTEMYEALCLHVLSEVSDEPCSQEKVVELVEYALGVYVQNTNALRLLVTETLQNLVDNGVLLCEAGLYSLRETESTQLPDDAGQERLDETIFAEIERIAHSLNPILSRKQIVLLHDFFMQVSDLVVQHQQRFISMGYGVSDITPDLLDISGVFAECVEKYGIEEFIDAEEFMRRALLHPSETLTRYLNTMLQVSVITQLLAWDPSLEYLRTTILSDKTLYLDSNLLFFLMEATNPLHQFLVSLLKASHEDLRVRLVVLESTLQEYERTINWANSFFQENHRHFRHIAHICLKEDLDPGQFDLENALFVDYMRKNLEHIDLGTWQSYLHSIRPAALRSLLSILSVKVSTQPLPFVPEQEFWLIKDAMLKASQIHVDLSKGKRRLKRDVEHDAKMYHLIKSCRTKGKAGDSSLGYDTYLLTLDGSLVHFTREMDIHYMDTFFMYPNQWYELAFPFLRLSMKDNTDFASGLASLVFSSAFPALASLIPLELCSYVFDLGGTDLPLSSVRGIVDALLERRLVESLDPSSTSEREREKAKLEIKRMIVEEERKTREEFHQLEEQAEFLEEKKVKLENQLAALEEKKLESSEELAGLEEDLRQYGGLHTTSEQIRTQFEQSVVEMKTRHAAEIERKDAEIAQHRAKVGQLEAELNRFRVLELKVNELEDELSRRLQEEKRRKEIRAFATCCLAGPVLLILVLGVATAQLVAWLTLWKPLLAALAMCVTLGLPWTAWVDRRGSRVPSISELALFRAFHKVRVWIFSFLGLAAPTLFLQAVWDLVKETELWLRVIQLLFP